jgi:hypothetical protein
VGYPLLRAQQTRHGEGSGDRRLDHRRVRHARSGATARIEPLSKTDAETRNDAMNLGKILRTIFVEEPSEERPLRGPD